MDKSKKIIIIFNVAYILFSIAYATENQIFHFSSVTSFIILMMPVSLYWSGVWIFGFGYILSFNPIFFFKRNRRFFRNTLFVVLFLVFVCAIIEKASHYKIPTKLERKQGCFILHNHINATCFNGKEYFNGLLKIIVNKKPFLLHTADCSVGFSINKPKQYVVPFSTNDDDYSRIIVLKEDLKNRGFKDAVDILSLKEHTKVSESKVCLRGYLYEKICSCKISQ